MKKVKNFVQAKERALSSNAPQMSSTVTFSLVEIYAYVRELKRIGNFNQCVVNRTWILCFEFPKFF